VFVVKNARKTAIVVVIAIVAMFVITMATVLLVSVAIPARIVMMMMVGIQRALLMIAASPAQRRLALARIQSIGITIVLAALAITM